MFYLGVGVPANTGSGGNGSDDSPTGADIIPVPAAKEVIHLPQ